MAISLKPVHVRLYADVARILVRYGLPDLARAGGLEIPSDAGSCGEAGEREEASPGDAQARALARDLEALGPTFIKAAQLLSTRSDILPVEYLAAFSRLQDQVEPFDGEQASRIVAEELGARVSKVFPRFDLVPVAAASLGQVHYAQLRDGRPVAVKVQRPEVRERVAIELEALEDMAELMSARSELGARFDLVGVVAEFRRSLFDELDYEREARNLERLGESLRELEGIVVPRPVLDLTTSRVLVMHWVEGTKITSLGPLARMEFDGRSLARQLFEGYLHQVLVDGFFHADPHPGNLFLTADGRIALLDLGMVGRITVGLQEKLVRFLLALCEGEGGKAAEAAMKIGEPGPEFDEVGFVSTVSAMVDRAQGLRAREFEVGRVVLSVNRTASEHGIRIPKELGLLGKTLLNLDQVGRLLDPEFDPNRAIRRNAAEILSKRMWKQASPGNVAASLIEMNEFVQELPSRLNRVLDLVAGNRLELRVDAFDETHLMEGLQKIANRITLGLVIAALIVGAAMLMRVETEFRLLGYPGLAILLFIGAVVGGIALVFSILLTDEKAGEGRARDPRAHPRR